MKSKKIHVTWTAKYTTFIYVDESDKLDSAAVSDAICDIDPCAACGPEPTDSKYVDDTFEILKVEVA